MQLPEAPLDHVLRRVDHVWYPGAAAHHILLGQSGAGKSTLIQALLGLCEYERVLIFDVKPAPDPVWDGPPDDEWRWGRPVQHIKPMFGFSGDKGGGPNGMWFRILGSPDRTETAKRFGEALSIIQAEGHVCAALDDVRELTRQLRLAEPIDSLMNLGRSAGTLAILGCTELGYVSGRQQGSQVWVGKTSGIQAAKDGAALLGKTGKDWYETTGAVPPHGWIYSEDREGNQGPVFVPPAAAE